MDKFSKIVLEKLKTCGVDITQFQEEINEYDEFMDFLNSNFIPSFKMHENQKNIIDAVTEFNIVKIHGGRQIGLTTIMNCYLSFLIHRNPDIQIAIIGKTQSSIEQIYIRTIEIFLKRKIGKNIVKISNEDNCRGISPDVIFSDYYEEDFNYEEIMRTIRPAIHEDTKLIFKNRLGITSFKEVSLFLKSM